MEKSFQLGGSFTAPNVIRAVRAIANRNDAGVSEDFSTAFHFVEVAEGDYRIGQISAASYKNLIVRHPERDFVRSGEILTEVRVEPYTWPEFKDESSSEYEPWIVHDAISAFANALYDALRDYNVIGGRPPTQLDPAAVCMYCGRGAAGGRCLECGAVPTVSIPVKPKFAGYVP